MKTFNYKKVIYFIKQNTDMKIYETKNKIKDTLVRYFY